jgi:TPR repeat protein
MHFWIALALLASVQGALAQSRDAALTPDLSTVKRQAASGDPKAEAELGTMYEKGDGVPQDYPQAASWFRKAAEQGAATAQNDLGTLYDHGQGVSQDHSQAAIWYRRAAEQNLAEAQYNLGVLYKHGWGVPQDYEKAYFWLDLAAAKKVEGIDVDRVRDDAASHLKPADLSRAQERARKWFEDHLKKANP